MTRLMTKGLASKIPKLYETESVPLPEKVVRTKLFHPVSQWTWYVIEYDGNDLCWGLVVGHETEFGYFSLTELSQVNVILPIERDRYFRPTQVQDLPIHDIGMAAAV